MLDIGFWSDFAHRHPASAIPQPVGLCPRCGHPVYVLLEEGEVCWYCWLEEKDWLDSNRLETGEAGDDRL